MPVASDFKAPKTSFMYLIINISLTLIPSPAEREAGHFIFYLALVIKHFSNFAFFIFYYYTTVFAQAPKGAFFC